MPEDAKRDGQLDIAGAMSRKYGPLPGWAWAGLVGTGALAWLWWRRRSAKAAGVNDTGPAGAGSTDQAAGDSGDAASYGVLQSEIMDLQGAMARTNTTATGGTTGSTTPTSGTTTPTTGSKPPAPKPAQKYTTVTVGKFSEPNPPWDSTLWGIATHYNVPGGYQALAKLNGIDNPNLIHEGQKIKVPVS